MGSMLEVGPATVRFRPNRQPDGRVRREVCRTSNSVELTAVALAGIDDTTVLFHERPVAVAELWRRVVSSSVGTHCESLTLVHPSWWVGHRVARVVDAAATVATDVRAVSRSAVIMADDPAAVVEIADDIVAISTPAAPTVVLTRPQDVDEILRVIETYSVAEVLIDSPPGVAGGNVYARGLLGAMRKRGVAARLTGIGEELPAAPTAEPTPVATPIRRWRGPACAAASVALTLSAIGFTAARPTPSSPSEDANYVVEGRVALRIPPGWVVTRVTAGPGSRRLQATAQSEQGVALHVTQSFVPGETLTRTAEVLRQAVADQPRHVFVDFNPGDRRGGRPAVTYREVRVGRDTRWTVVLDGSTRISVGCQSVPGREEAIAGPCEQAIRTAHEVTGTNPSS